MKIKIKLLSEKAKAPTRGSALSAGYDLYAAENTVIPALGRGLVGTGIAVSYETCVYLKASTPFGQSLTTSNDMFNSSYELRPYFRIAPRSGLAVKHGIDVGAGVVDADYRGEVKVLLFNLSSIDFEVKVGDRIAQMIPEVTLHPTRGGMEVVEELDWTARGAGGFGSTGK